MVLKYYPYSLPAAFRVYSAQSIDPTNLKSLLAISLCFSPIAPLFSPLSSSLFPNPVREKSQLKRDFSHYYFSKKRVKNFFFFDRLSYFFH